MRIWILAIATVAVLIGVAGGSYWYGGNGADESALVLNRAPAASDGIKVHGDWTLTVSNPDGSVDSVHEFENAFISSHGSAVLMWALMGEGMSKNESGTNTYRVFLRDYKKDEVCNTSNPFKDDVFQISTSVAMSGPSFSDTEAFQVDMTCRVKEGMTSIEDVWLRALLNSALAPSYDGVEQKAFYNLTKKEFSSPISVVPGQVVSTTVRITFE